MNRPKSSRNCTCGKPAIKSTNGLPIVKCRGPCAGTFHAFCVDLNRSLLASLEAASSNLQWFCDGCRDASSSVTSKEVPRPGGAILKKRSVKVKTENRTIAAQLLGRREPPASVNSGQDSMVTVLQNVCAYLWAYEFMKLRRVCHRWKQIIEGSSVLMERAVIKIPKRVELSREFKPELFPPSTSIRLFGSKILWINSWWPSLCQRLVYLNLECCEVSRPMLFELLNQATKLKRLHLYFAKTTNNSKSVNNVRLPNLEELEIDRISAGSIIKNLVCPRLQRFRCDVVEENMLRETNGFENILNVCCYTQNTVIQMNYMTHLSIGILSAELDKRQNMVDQICKYMLGLKYLKLHNKLCAHNNISLKFANLKLLTQLEHLDLDFPFVNVDLSDAVNPTLRIFKFHGYFSESALERYLNSCECIRSLTFFCCTFSSWRQMFTIIGLHCQSLQRLELLGCIVKCSDECNPEYFDELRYLKLEFTNIPPQLLKFCFSSCPNVDEVELSCIKNVNDDVISEMLRKMKRLRKLNNVNVIVMS